MNLFDSIQDNVFAVCTTTFGYSAFWLPSGGGPAQTATVLYKDATDKHGLSDQDYIIERYVIEYSHTDFVGLKDSVTEGGNEKVQVTIKEGLTLEFLVRRIETKFDGKTIVAYLNPPA